MLLRTFHTIISTPQLSPLVQLFISFAETLMDLHLDLGQASMMQGISLTETLMLTVEVARFLLDYLEPTLSLFRSVVPFVPSPLSHLIHSSSILCCACAAEGGSYQNPKVMYRKLMRSDCALRGRQKYCRQANTLLQIGRKGRIRIQTLLCRPPKMTKLLNVHIDGENANCLPSSLRCRG